MGDVPPTLGAMNKISDHAEDIALAVGTLSASLGAGVAFGIGYGLMTFGVLLTAYGVWITERRS